MVLAIAALLLHLAPSIQPLPDVTVIPVASVALADKSADKSPDKSLDQPASRPSVPANSAPDAASAAKLTTASLESSSQNSQSLSTIRVPDVQPTKSPNPILVERYPSRKTWLLLAIAEHSAATFDAYSTRQAVSNGATEADPLMRPFAHSPGIYAAIQVAPAVLDFTARRMQRSQNNIFRRTWWLPQSAGTALFLFSGVHNLNVAGQH